MSRQDANAAFALSSFLQGTNATYIDDLYARYEQDPNSVDAEWREFFKSLKDAPADVQKNAGFGPSYLDRRCSSKRSGCSPRACTSTSRRTDS